MYTVYKVTNKLNNKYYIGVHKTTNPNDSYLGSGLAILAAIKKHGRQNFVKEILFVFDNAKEAFEKEIELTSDFRRNDTYNMRVGGVGGFTIEQSRKGISLIPKGTASKAGKRCVELKAGYHSQTKAQLSENGRRGGLAHKGREKTEEHKENLRRSLTGKKRPVEVCERIRLAKLGKKLSTQQKLNVSAAMKESWKRRKLLVEKSKSGDPLLITE